jgi:hypothetical protein
VPDAVISCIESRRLYRSEVGAGGPDASAPDADAVDVVGTDRP